MLLLNWDSYFCVHTLVETKNAAKNIYHTLIHKFYISTEKFFVKTAVTEDVKVKMILRLSLNYYKSTFLCKFVTKR